MTRAVRAVKTKTVVQSLEVDNRGPLEEEKAEASAVPLERQRLAGSHHNLEGLSSSTAGRKPAQTVSERVLIMSERMRLLEERKK